MEGWKADGRHLWQEGWAIKHAARLDGEAIGSPDHRYELEPRPFRGLVEGLIVVRQYLSIITSGAHVILCMYVYTE